MAALLALALVLGPALPLRAKTSVISVDPGDPGYDAARATKSAKKGAPTTGGDIEVGPMTRPGSVDADDESRYTEPPRKAAGRIQSGSRVPAIFAVYDERGRWLVVPRRGNARVRAGAGVVVIGSRGVGEFTVRGAVTTRDAACSGSRRLPTRAWALTARDARLFKRVGVPVVGILLRPGTHFDTRRARFSPLRDVVSEAVYRHLDAPLRAAAAADIASGAFKPDANDTKGQRFAAAASADQVELKLDFAARLRVNGLKDPMVVVEGAEFMRSFRRCLQLVDGDKPVGACVVMPNVLMAETAALDFVAYAPARGVDPFILAYTPKPPLWGHERWGFQTTGKGARLFLSDALDPRCRESF